MGNIAQLKDDVINEVNATGEHRTLLDFLINSKEDVYDFLEIFDGNTVHSIFSFQIHKRNNSNITLNQFLIGMLQDEKKALEELFQEPVLKIHFNLIYDLNITHEEIFARFKEQNNRSFLNILNNWNINNYEETDLFLLNVF